MLTDVFYTSEADTGVSIDVHTLWQGTCYSHVLVSGRGKPPPSPTHHAPPVKRIGVLREAQGGSSGAVDAPAYDDPSGAADGDMIGLLKGIYALLAQIEENTRPTP